PDLGRGSRNPLPPPLAPAERIKVKRNSVLKIERQTPKIITKGQGGLPLPLDLTLPPPGGGILKTEVGRLVAGLGVLEQQAVGVKSQAGNHHHSVVVVQVQQGPVPGGGVVHGDPALGGGDAEF